MGLGDQGAMMQVPDIKVHVTQVKVSGLNRTKNDIVVEQISDVLSATSLHSVLLESLMSVEKLNGLNIFKSVSLRLHASNEKDGREGAVGKSGIIVTFDVKEKGRFKTSIGANVGTQSGDASVSGSIYNVFGRAELASLVSSTTFPHWGQSTQFQFFKPYYKDIDKTLTFSFGTTHNKRPVNGFEEIITGPSLLVRFPSLLGIHSLAWNGDWRRVYGFSHGVPMSIREEAGHSLKSAIKHVLEVDERDDPLHPSSGFLVKVAQEMAGFGGDVFYGRTELQSEFYKQLPAGCVFSLSLWGGAMGSYSGHSHAVDRFLLGGASTLRGFGLWGVGPRERGFSKGGEAYWATGAHLFLPLPLVRNEIIRRIRIHSFLTAGNLINMTRLSQLRNLSSGCRCSAGIGLHVKLGLAQLELNYAVPLVAQEGDSVNPGLQFGVGIEML